MSIPFFSAKDPDEIIVLTMDFTNVVGAATIVSAVWLCEQQDGTAVTPASVLSGAVDIATQPLVKQKVIGGTAGITYLHRAEATLSDGRCQVIGAYLPVSKGA